MLAALVLLAIWYAVFDSGLVSCFNSYLTSCPVVSSIVISPLISAYGPAML